MTKLPPTRQGEAFLVGAVRTPYGRRGGALSCWHPVDLSSQALSGVLAATGAKPEMVGAVVWGCTSQVGAQACNIARRAALAAGWPEEVHGVTIDAHALSSAEAVSWAVSAVKADAYDLVAAGGVEVMTAVPVGAALAQPATGKPLGRRLAERYRGQGGFVPPGLAAEEVARRYGFSRGDLDACAVRSFERAREAQPTSASFLVPLAGPTGQVGADENLGRPPSLTQLSRLAPAFVEGGSVTAGNIAAEGDGASAVLVANAKAVRSLGLTPAARVVSTATSGAAPHIWPTAAAPASLKALQHAGAAVARVGHWQVLETSAAAVLAFAADTGVDLGALNVEGGALATTAPLGALGAGLFAAAVGGITRETKGLALVSGAAEGGLGWACVLASAS